MSLVKVLYILCKDFRPISSAFSTKTNAADTSDVPEIFFARLTSYTLIQVCKRLQALIPYKGFIIVHARGFGCFSKPLSLWLRHRQEFYHVAHGLTVFRS